MVFVVVVGIQIIASGAYWSVQPAVGEQWLITMFGSRGVGRILYLYNGTIHAIMTENPVVSGAEVIKLFVNNTIYFEINNGDPAGMELSYCGVKL